MAEQEAPRNPAADQDIPEGSTVIQFIQLCRREAEEARKSRLAKNRRNRDAYLGRQDWGHKQAGQSAEFLPKTGIAVEQVAAVFNKALTQFGDWFSVDINRGQVALLQPHHVVGLLRCYLESLRMEDGRIGNFSALMTDGIKIGLLESLIVFKVHGMGIAERTFQAEPGQIGIGEDGMPFRAEPELLTIETRKWRLAINLIRPEDYYPDPTGRGLYEIHRSERDYNHLVAMSDAGIYDPAAVAAVITTMEKELNQKRRMEAANQDETTIASFRRQVVIDEFWGNILDSNGRVVHRNVVAAVANDHFLIRPPEPNPFWHQESPFVVSPLIRVPFSTWHKSLYDDAVDLNRAMNEIYNLMIDGGLASVWGVKQLRIDALEDPTQVTNGIPQGMTLVVKDSLPAGVQVMETVSSGEVPRDAMAMFELLNREFTQAAMTNELKLGSLPPRQVKATEIVEISQSQAVTLDSLAADVEISLIVPLLRKAWLTILQHIEEIDVAELAGAMGDQAALLVTRLAPAERFAAFATLCSFKAHGLSATMSRVKDFQKFMALMQAVATNPLLMEAFVTKFSADKALTHILRALNVNPDNFMKNEAELAQTQQQMQRVAQLSQITGGGRPSPNGGMGVPEGADQSMPAEINQVGNPLSGMAGA